MSDYGSGKLLLVGDTSSQLTNIKSINANIDALMAKLPEELQSSFREGLSYLSDEKFNIDTGKLEGFRQGGLDAMNQALALQGIGPNALTGDQVSQYFNNMPGTQFEMDQGRRSVEASAAKKGLNGSGSLLKGLTSYAQGIAAKQFGARQQELANLANIGMQAGQTQASLGQQNKLQAAGLLQNLGTSLASNQVNLEGMRTSALQQAMNTKTYKTEQGSVMTRLENAAGR